MSEIRIPDFYIVGASKCGTTALSEYVRQHPNVCFARTKEPHYFSDDRPAQKVDVTLEQYWRRNFSYFDPHKHLAIGEGSGTYYSSDVAVPNILEANPAAKFIYMIRNPVDMVVSWYYDLRFSGSEVESLEDGWALQAARAEGREIPPLCPDPVILQYRTMASLGTRLDFLKRHIPQEQLLVIVMDDFIRDTKQAYEEVLAFIGLPSDGRTEFPVVNSAKEARSKVLTSIGASLPRWLVNMVREAKHLLGLTHVPLNFIARLNTRPLKKAPLSPELREKLLAAFEPEIQLLETHLARDLSAWRN